LGPIPHPQSPIPNPQSPSYNILPEYNYTLITYFYKYRKYNKNEYRK